MTRLAYCLCCGIFLAGCNQAPPADTTLGAAHSANWQDQLNQKNVEGVVNLYTEDARIMPPNGETKVGHAAVREEFGAMIAADMTIKLTSIESRAAGDVGYNVGTYVLSAAGEVVDEGKWIEVWRRGADGIWRISNDIWNSDNPAVDEAKPAMTYMIATHNVGDPATWLAAWRGENGRRKDFAANGAPHVHVMQSPDDASMTGLIIALDDPAAFDAWLKSDDGQAAATDDTVDMKTLNILIEVE